MNAEIINGYRMLSASIVAALESLQSFTVHASQPRSRRDGEPLSLSAIDALTGNYPYRAALAEVVAQDATYFREQLNAKGDNAEALADIFSDVTRYALQQSETARLNLSRADLQARAEAAHKIAEAIAGSDYRRDVTAAAREQVMRAACSHARRLGAWDAEANALRDEFARLGGDAFALTETWGNVQDGERRRRNGEDKRQKAAARRVSKKGA